jgi:hypothetical protein
LVQMEIQRQRLSHAVHTYCHHTKTETWCTNLFRVARPSTLPWIV